MRIFLGILTFIILLAIVFFAYNHHRLDIYKLDNGIGSVSVVNLDLFDYDDHDNVNTYTTTILNPSVPLLDRDIDFIVNRDSILGEDVRTYYSNLSEYWQTGEFSDFRWSYNPLNGSFKGGVRIVIDDFNLPYKPLSNVRYTPQEFYELYPTGLTLEFDGARMYRWIYFTSSDSFITLKNLSVHIYCAPNPLNSSEYILNVVPVSVKYEYNLVKTIQQLDYDINLIRAAKPFYPDSIPDDNNFDLFKKLYSFIIYPYNYIGYVTESCSILIHDLAGFIVINDLTPAF